MPNYYIYPNCFIISRLKPPILIRKLVVSVRVGTLAVPIMSLWRRALTIRVGGYFGFSSRYSWEKFPYVPAPGCRGDSPVGSSLM